VRRDDGVEVTGAKHQQGNLMGIK